MKELDEEVGVAASLTKEEADRRRTRAAGRRGDDALDEERRGRERGLSADLLTHPIVPWRADNMKDKHRDHGTPRMQAL